MPTSSRIVLRQELAQRLYGSESFLTGEVDSGTTTTLVDALLISTVAGANHFVGHWVFIHEAGDAAPEEQARMVSQYNPVNGTLTFDPAFTTNAPASGDDYELHPKLHPDRLNEALNWALEFGSNGGFAAITDDDLTTSVIYDKEILMEGALYYLKQGMAREEHLSRSGWSLGWSS